MPLAFNMSRYFILKFSDRPFKRYDFLNVRSVDVKIFLPVATNRKVILYHICASPILVVCGLLPGESNLTSVCQWDSKPAYFSSPGCSLTDEAVKTQKQVLCGGLRSAPIKEQWVAKDKISIYLGKMNF
jgi:hypothetical protein